MQPIKIVFGRFQTNGFFIECGGYDGEFLSNTLFMERYLGWSGLLIEADRKAFNKLLTRNRKAYTTPVCLSTELYPIQVSPAHISFFRGIDVSTKFIFHCGGELQCYCRDPKFYPRNK